MLYIYIRFHSRLTYTVWHFLYVHLAVTVLELWNSSQSAPCRHQKPCKVVGIGDLAKNCRPCFLLLLIFFARADALHCGDHRLLADWHRSCSPATHSFLQIEQSKAKKKENSPDRFDTKPVCSEFHRIPPRCCWSPFCCQNSTANPLFVARLYNCLSLSECERFWSLAHAHFLVRGVSVLAGRSKHFNGGYQRVSLPIWFRLLFKFHSSENCTVAVP